jgi:hypothetical protein
MPRSVEEIYFDMEDVYCTAHTVHNCPCCHARMEDLLLELQVA